MSLTTPVNDAPQSDIDQPRVVAVVSWKAPIIFGIFTVLFALLPLLVPRPGMTTFRLAEQNAAIAVPDVLLPATPTAWIAVVLLALCTGYACRSG
jgi:simple sugar transport system permease protein